MKKILLATAVISLLNVAIADDFKTEDEKFNYAIGLQIGNSLKDLSNTIKVDPSLISSAITDSLEDKTLRLTDEEMATTLQALQTKAAQSQMEQQKKAAEENAEEEKAFLEKNKAVEGVQVTESGLQYRILQEGSGKKPKATDSVSVHYVGTLPDGTKFDSSRDRNAPVEFALTGVIKGWTEGLQLMSEGAKYEFVIPSNLAYGTNAPPSIGPNRALVFEVELLKVIDQTAQ